jgi:putative ABC transport system permease protein
MKLSDLLRLTVSTFVVYRMRSILTGMGIAIGVAAVILLTSIGEGLHQYLLDEFSQFGTNIITIQPGKSQTHGGNAGIFGSVKPLTIEDAHALHRVPALEFVNPSVQGNAEVRADGKSRRTFVYGAGPDLPRAFKMNVQLGNFLPADESSHERNFVVLGKKVREELFSNVNPLGAYVRIGGERYRIIGVMAGKGQVLGFDMDDIVYIPAARALDMFNRAGLIEIHVNYQSSADVNKVVESIKAILTARHGREDYTVITQEQALEVMNSVLGVITFAVAAIGAISLLVGGVGILTIMTMAVSERTGEIGLLRALGARRQQVLMLFLGEAILLSAAGGFAGLIIGMGVAQLLHMMIPSLPVQVPLFFAILAESSAVLIGLLAGVMPARNASLMDPVEALRSE